MSKSSYFLKEVVAPALIIVAIVTAPIFLFLFVFLDVLGLRNPVCLTEVRGTTTIRRIRTVSTPKLPRTSGRVTTSRRPACSDRPQPLEGLRSSLWRSQCFFFVLLARIKRIQV